MADNRLKKGRVIFHVDMNSFYASVESAYDHTLKGKPLAIAGNVEERRGIIVTCSYEARAKGVKTTMPIWQAKRLCPELIIRPPNFDRYRSASEKMFQLLEEYTPLVEPVSIDEGYIDITNYTEDPIKIAYEIQHRLQKELDLPCSIGIALNKFLAKMASEMKKPLGITILRKRELDKKLWTLPVGEMHGVGKKTAEKLIKLNIRTIGDLAHTSKDILSTKFGVNGVKLFERANGVDARPVDPSSFSEFKSVGNSTTLKADTTSEEKVKIVLTNLAGSVGRRLRRKQVCANTVQLTIRYSDRKTITRSKSLDYPIQSSEELLEYSLFLFRKYWNKEPIRLLGITGQNLVDEQYGYKQLDLFNYEKDAKSYELLKTVDEIRNKYGESSLIKGGQAKGDPSELLRDKKRRGTSLDKDFLRERSKNDNT
ncbi:DNA polymerase IV [Bacillus sp. FJAT-45350]|uniref:DNA polymerase IV n=1 Tax=Bacillus sp. FJAT-45350 TaxID=2011014 RepID=UPI000BB6FB26|nr:DNA polymerase IV [Bacillus sp. FJAT-45350]